MSVARVVVRDREHAEQMWPVISGAWSGDRVHVGDCASPITHLAEGHQPLIASWCDSLTIVREVVRNVDEIL